MQNLARSGFAVSDRRGVTLLDLDGGSIQRLAGFEVAGNVGNDGVWLQRGRNYFKVDPRRDRLEAVERAVARDAIYDEGRPPDLPPIRHRGRAAGRWRFATPGPAGRELAQWSGECEVPIAFWVEDGRAVVLVTGKRKLGGPESLALGWSPRGEALAFLPVGVCGPGVSRPGIYAFSAAGGHRLVHETPSGVFVRVDMW